MNNKNNFLEYFPPMGIYETLYKFHSVFGSYMGTTGTHPWSQGFPLTTQIPNGPEIPSQIKITADDLKYPKAWGSPKLRSAIANYYNKYYSSSIEKDNVMIFAGGRPALVAILMFLQKDIQIRIASTEYTPYYDMLEILNKKYTLVDSCEENKFTPSVDAFLGQNDSVRELIMLSNPCNPTGITKTDHELKSLVEKASYNTSGLLVDEAYELFHEPPVSAISYIKDINHSNFFLTGAATKGLQAPGIRIGWVVTSKRNIEILGNFSSFGMGGVSRPSQLYALELFNRERINLARTAIPKFYKEQRNRYREAFTKLDFKIFSGKGGFYHWCKLPNGITSEEFNHHLFKHGAAILKGTDCDMERGEDNSSLREFFRFSFGPLKPDSYESDIKILNRVLDEF
tara:strand:+ start:714 stop:1910 length:1197 start_codon:yes stop_codon:yes gene_type:complete